MKTEQFSDLTPADASRATRFAPLWFCLCFMALATRQVSAQITLSAEPRTNASFFGDDLTLSATNNASGTKYSTRRIRVADMLATIPAQMTNASNLFVGAHTGNGIGLTNISGTNVSIATVISTGTIASNDFLRLSVAASDNSVWRTPPLVIDSWYHYGSSWTAANISNEFQGILDGNLGNYWDIWYILDDGWQGGITNGILMPDLGKINITNMCADAHRCGIRVLLYTEPTVTSSAGFPGNNTTNWKANAAAWATWGVDGLKIDMTAGSQTDMSDKLNVFRGLVAQARKGFFPNQLAIFTGGWRDNVTDPNTSNFWGDQVLATANAMRPVTDNAPNGLNNLWTNFVFNYVPVYERQRELNRPSHWLHLDQAVNQPAGAGWDGTNASRGMITMFSLFSCVMDTPITGSPTGDPTRYGNLTHPFISKIHQDALFAPAYRIASNNLGSVWTRKLSDGTRVACFLNHQTNATYTSNATWLQLGFASNQLCSVVDAWTGATVTNDYGQFTSPAVSNLCANAYIIAPLSNATTVVFKTVPIMAFANVDSHTIATSLGFAAGVPGIQFDGLSAANRAEFPIPIDLMTTVNPSVILRFGSATSGTLFYQCVLGWEQAGVQNSIVLNGNVAVTGLTPVYVTNTFAGTTIGADAYGLRFGVTASSTNNLRLFEMLIPITNSVNSKQ